MLSVAEISTVYGSDATHFQDTFIYYCTFKRRAEVVTFHIKAKMYNPGNRAFQIKFPPIIGITLKILNGTFDVIVELY